MMWTLMLTLMWICMVKQIWAGCGCQSYFYDKTHDNMITLMCMFILKTDVYINVDNDVDVDNDVYVQVMWRYIKHRQLITVVLAQVVIWHT